MPHGPRRRAVCLFASLLLLLGLSPPVFAQAITYEYDALGRLILVSAPEGIARYEYDAVGNITRIRSGRYADTPDPVAILMLNPTTGPIGTEVHLYGKGFSPTPGNNQVAFNGTPATVTAATANRLVTTVPPGATTGSVTLTTPQGSAVSPEPFTVLGSFVVIPPEATVVLGKAVRFQATLDAVPTPEVTWQVEGIPAGNGAFGTISADGLYTAPANPSPVEPLRVQAIRTSDSTQTATARVMLVPASGGSAVATRLSVGPPVPPSSEARLIGGPLSVGPPAPAATASPLAASPLSVAPPVAALTASPLAAHAVSVSALPVLTGVSPTTGARGTSVLVTLTGVGLAGATGLTVLKDGAVDSTVTVSDLTAAPDGTQATATLTIASGAVLGDRILRITAAGASSTALGTGGNGLRVY
jgi:YD repeat-containing protein